MSVNSGIRRILHEPGVIEQPRLILGQHRCSRLDSFLLLCVERGVDFGQGEIAHATGAENSNSIESLDAKDDVGIQMARRIGGFGGPMTARRSAAKPTANRTAPGRLRHVRLSSDMIFPRTGEDNRIPACRYRVKV
jgi:hypothetical protein